MSIRPPVHVPPPVPPESEIPTAAGTKSANDACKDRLNQLNLNPEAKIYPKTMPPGELGTEIKIQTNVFGLEVIKSSYVFQYSVHMKADLTPTKEAVFTKKGKEDFVVLDRHEKCVSILNHAMHAYPDFFQPADRCYVYDGQSLLFSTTDIFDTEPEGTKTKVFEFNGEQIAHEDLKRLPHISLEVSVTKNVHVKFTQEDIGRRTSDSNIDAIHGAYRQILELALNQYSLHNPTRCVIFEHGKIFFFKPERDYNRNDYVDVGDGKQMVPGIKKTVQFIEGPQGRGSTNPSVIIDGMKVAFHKEQLVFEKLEELSGHFANGLNDFERERCAPVLKGLDCYTTYGQRERHLRIEGIHHNCAVDSRFELKDGSTASVEEYFKLHHNVTLKYPRANLIVCKDKGNLNFFPTEALKISPNQRVTISQQTSAQSQKTIKESAVLPDVRQRLIVAGKTAADIQSENETLSRLGVMVSSEPLMVTGRQFPSAKLAAAAGKPLMIRDSKWRINQYVRPASAPSIWALYCVGNQNTRFTHDLLGRFGEEFVNMIKQKGVDFPPPTENQLVFSSEIVDKLHEAAKSKCTYVLIITDDSITNLHQQYKTIESTTGMIIQDMKVSRAISVVQAQKRLTLENVINKTNVKLGGNNYILSETNRLLNDHLIIGIGFSHPPAGTRFILEGKGSLNPTVVGYSYNGNQSQEFSGDFMLCPAGQDTISSVDEILTQAITGYRKWHGDNNPKRILVYRCGTSEGSHGSVIAYEIPLARSAIKKFSTTINLVYINVSKDHTCRLFRKDLNEIASKNAKPPAGSQASANRPPVSTQPKPWDLNIGPGVCIDSQITHPGCKQFYLNSHITLQGTTKTPLYSVLADDMGVSMKGLEELTYNLCHLHQIVGLSTSVPTPLYVANEYAKRGREIWNQYCERDPTFRHARGPERERLREISQEINYQVKFNMIERRVNA